MAFHPKCEAGLTAYATPLDINQITAASLAADAALGFCADGEVDRHVRFVGAVHVKDADPTRA